MAAAGLIAERPALAAAKSWDGGGSTNDWSVAANWNPDGVPGIADDVTISTGSNTITIDTNVDVNSLTISGTCTRAFVPAGAQTIRTRADFTLSASGGSFTLSSATTQIGGRFNRTNTNTTVNANGGTVVFDSTGSVTHAFNGAQFSRVTIGTTSGLVGYWKLDEASGATAADNSGSGNAGTLGGGYSRTSGPSAISFTNPSALTLNGATGYVALGVNGLPAHNAIQSFSVWVNFPSAAGTQNILALTNNSNSGVQLGIRGGALTVWEFGGGTIVSTTVPSTGTWHHIAYTWDGTTNRLYVDGGTATTSTTAHQTGATTLAYLGTYNGSAELYGGSLDDARIYNRVLSGTEVGTLASGSELSSGTGGTHTFGSAFVSTGSLTIGAGTVTGSSTFSVGGSWLNTGTFTGTGAVTFTGTSAGNVVVSGGATFGAVTVNGSGGSYQFGDPFITSGNFTITAGTVSSSSTMRVAGNWSNSGTFWSTGTVTLARTTSGGTILSNGSLFGGLTINGSGGTYTLQDRLWVPGGTVTLTNGTLNAGTFTARIGAFAQTSGSFAAATGTVILDSPSNQTLPVATFNSLRVDTGKEANLVGYWKLDGGAGPRLIDASGTGNHGSLSAAGATWSSSVPSAITYDDPNSITFNGSTGNASLGVTNLPANDAAQSVSMWVNPTVNTGTQTMMAMANPSAGNGLQIGIRGGTLTAWLWGGTILATTTLPTTGSWHHVVFTWDGTTNSLYIDNAAPGTSTTAHQTATPTTAYLATYDGGSEPYSGLIDDVRVYNVALTATQVSRLAAGRYAGTGGYATVTLGANTTVGSQLAIDAGEVNTSTRTMNHSLASSAAAINTGTYTVGSAAQTFAGGLTVQAGGTLALPTNLGSVQIAGTKALTMDGTLNASNTGATIRSVTGTYAFTIGSTAAARPTLNITGLAVQNTDLNGMRINADHAAVTTFTRFDNITFTAGTTTFLNIYATSLYLASSGCQFGVTDALAALPTNNITLTGNGTGDGETRMVLGTATCNTNKATAGYCNDNWAADDDSDNDGVGDITPTTGNESVVQYIRGAGTDTAGTVEGFPTAAFNWNTFAYYSTYVAFHDVSGTVDRIYVRSQTGAAEYSWDTPSGEEIVGTPRWVTVSGVNYVYVATASGKVYRLIDNTVAGTLTTDTTSPNWSGGNNPFDCGCTIKTPLTMDATNLYWAGTTAGPVQKVWTLGQDSRAMPSVAFTITPVVTSGSPTLQTVGSVSYLYLGLVGNIIKLDATNQTLMGTNTSPGSATIFGRVSVGGDRVFAGDSAGNMWAIATNSFTGVSAAHLWQYPISGDFIQSSSFYDFRTTMLHFGTEKGKVVVLSAAGVAMNGYPFTPDLATDAIRAAPLYLNGILVVGTTTGKLYFYDRNDGIDDNAPPTLRRKYYFGPTQQISGIGYDSTTGINRYMVSTSDPTTKDGRLYFIDALTDLTTPK